MQIATGQTETRNPIHARIIQDKFKHYGVEDAEEYKQKLRKMTVWDLSEEAVKSGLPPGADQRERIERKLLEQFKKDKQSYEIAAGKYAKPEIKTKEPSPEVKELLDFMRH